MDASHHSADGGASASRVPIALATVGALERLRKQLSPETILGVLFTAQYCSAPPMLSPKSFEHQDKLQPPAEKEPSRLLLREGASLHAFWNEPSTSLNRLTAYFFPKLLTDRMVMGYRFGPLRAAEWSTAAGVAPGARPLSTAAYLVPMGPL